MGTEPKKKVCYVGAPAIFSLEMACQTVNDAFREEDEIGCCYLVGSCMERPDWRDVDVRYIMSDGQFQRLFLGTYEYEQHILWEQNPRWLLLITSISNWLQKQTGLPVDFQIQPQTFANKHHDKGRSAIGIKVTMRDAHK
jgi:hypothetical protein